MRKAGSNLSSLTMLKAQALAQDHRLIVLKQNSRKMNSWTNYQMSCLAVIRPNLVSKLLRLIRWEILRLVTNDSVVLSKQLENNSTMMVKISKKICGTGLIRIIQKVVGKESTAKAKPLVLVQENLVRQNLSVCLTKSELLFLKRKEPLL